MEHDVDGLADLEVQRDVVVDEEEVVVPQVLDVLQRARVQVVDGDDPIPLAQQVIAEVGAEEAGPTGNDGRRHRRDATGAPGQETQALRAPNTP